MADDESEDSLGEGEEEEEEYREVDPMQVIEDRLLLLEAWLHDDPYQEEVNQKREEYLSLMEELEILGKKMRKTDKLLAVPNQPNLAKLERKRDQYEREVTDIVLYAEQDSFFDMEGENGEAALNAFMNANSLLGKPLETLAEMSGFEDSKAWNESFGTLAGSTREERTLSNHNRKRDPGNSGNSVSKMDMSKPHNQTIIKKKLKKAKQLLEDTTSESERKKLLKKLNEYNEALKRASVEKDESSDEEEEGSHSSEESIDPPTKILSPRKNTPAKKTKKSDEEEEGDPAYILLKKKLIKAKKMLQTATTSQEVEKPRKKVDEYLRALAKYPAWKQDQLAYGYGAGHSVAEEDNDAEWMEHQAVADEERLVQEEIRQQANQHRRSQAKSILGARNKPQKASSSNDSVSSDDSLDLDKYIEEERKLNKVIRKKLKKVEQMIQDKLKREGEGARNTKDFRKLQKKKKEYLTQLGEDHSSLANISVCGSSMNMSSFSSDVQISMMDLGVNDDNDDDREYRLAKEAKDQERQREREARLAAKASKNKHNDDDDDPDVQLVRKKLKKLEKMLRATESGSKDEEKLLKKKRQYLAELGEEQ
jgi:hypothetical protein